MVDKPKKPKVTPRVVRYYVSLILIVVGVNVALYLNRDAIHALVSGETDVVSRVEGEAEPEWKITQAAEFGPLVERSPFGSKHDAPGNGFQQIIELEPPYRATDFRFVSKAR